MNSVNMTKYVVIPLFTLTTCFLLCSCGVPFRNCGDVEVAEVMVTGCSSKQCGIPYGQAVDVTAVIIDRALLKRKFKSSEASVKQYGMTWKVPVSLNYGVSHLDYSVILETGKTELLRDARDLYINSSNNKQQAMWSIIKINAAPVDKKRPGVFILKSLNDDYSLCVEFDVHVT